MINTAHLNYLINLITFDNYQDKGTILFVGSVSSLLNRLTCLVASIINSSKSKLNKNEELLKEDELKIKSNIMEKIEKICYIEEFVQKICRYGLSKIMRKI